MGRSQTFTKLLDKCETSFQTHIILAQLAQLRKSDRERGKPQPNLNPRAGATSVVMLIFTAAGALIFWSACNLAGSELDKVITRAIGY